jgi:Zn-finger nucleic acid-binding protein
MELAASGRHFSCRHCGSTHFPEPAAADGIRVVGYTTDARPCPVCATAMAHALLDEQPVQVCERCRGLLLRRVTFADLIHAHRAWATSPARSPGPLPAKSLERQLTCPQCGEPFETYPYGGPGNVVIDGCARCDVIWLDYGEFRQIVDAPGRDRGRLSG